MGHRKHNLDATIDKVLSDAESLSDPNVRQLLVNIKTGIYNSHLDEPINKVIYDKAPSEHVYSGLNNTFIVFGRDRPGRFNGDGYGAQGVEKAGAIDIVVGRWSKHDATKFKGVPQSSNFAADASRIYISQQSDIDSYFQLPHGSTGASIARAAIGIKSDDIRIISRNTFKIVTNSDNECSNGELNDKITGLQVIAVNSNSFYPNGNNPDNIDYNDLQPMVKGDNLQAALVAMKECIAELNGQLTQFMKIQSEYNKIIANHTHPTPFYGKPTFQSTQLLKHAPKKAFELFTTAEQGVKLNLSNLNSLDTKYLNLDSIHNIKSKYHKLN